MKQLICTVALLASAVGAFGQVRDIMPWSGSSNMSGLKDPVPLEFGSRDRLMTITLRGIEQMDPMIDPKIAVDMTPVARPLSEPLPLRNAVQKIVATPELWHPGDGKRALRLNLDKARDSQLNAEPLPWGNVDFNGSGIKINIPEIRVAPQEVRLDPPKR